MENLKILNRIAAIAVLFLNLYFLPLTLILIKERAGSIGFGLSCPPDTLAINLLLIPALLVFTKKYENSSLLFIVNVVGSCFAVALMVLLLISPKMD